FGVEQGPQVGTGLLGKHIKDGRKDFWAFALLEQFDGELALAAAVAKNRAKAVEGAAGIQLRRTAGSGHGAMVQEPGWDRDSGVEVPRRCWRPGDLRRW